MIRRYNKVRVVEKNFNQRTGKLMGFEILGFSDSRFVENLVYRHNKRGLD